MEGGGGSNRGSSTRHPGSGREAPEDGRADGGRRGGGHTGEGPASRSTQHSGCTCGPHRGAPRGQGRGSRTRGEAGRAVCERVAPQPLSSSGPLPAKHRGRAAWGGAGRGRRSSRPLPLRPRRSRRPEGSPLPPRPVKPPGPREEGAQTATRAPRPHRGPGPRGPPPAPPRAPANDYEWRGTSDLIAKGNAAGSAR